MESLWPTDLNVDGDIRTPKMIIEEQARLLGEATHGLLLADVKVNSNPSIGESIRNEIFAAGKGSFQIMLQLLVPDLNNYRYGVLEAYHGLEPYPLVVMSEYLSGETKRVACANEGEFIRQLGSILRSDGLKEVIQRLLALAK